MIRGLTVVGDVLRPDGQGRPGGADRLVRWLFNVLRRQLAAAAGLPVGLLTTRGCPPLAEAIVARRAPELADRHWAACYQTLAWDDALADAVLRPLEDQFCIGYELPPYLMRALETCGVPYIDVRLHPIRFLDDLLFAVRASRPATQAALLDLAVAESAVLVTAGLREAMCQFISEATVPPDTLLVIGQRPFDSSQIIDGGFFDAAQHAPRIRDICCSHPAVVLKPHPHERHHSLLVCAAGSGANVIGALSDNLYRILSLPEISAVLTVNSSVAYEAPYFGKTVHALAPTPVRIAWRGETPGPDVHASLDDRVLTVDFWRTVLAPHAPVTAPDGVRLAPKPNRLRIALDSFWNFQEIDTDRVPRGGSG
ncbi:MAG TPA: hypothetical protein VFW75_13850 [Acetobacteraceae bacterium]|nr:hypothetical protein [Acetobacteraceae bacterium]